MDHQQGARRLPAAHGARMFQLLGDASRARHDRRRQRVCSRDHAREAATWVSVVRREPKKRSSPDDRCGLRALRRRASRGSTMISRPGRHRRQPECPIPVSSTGIERICDRCRRRVEGLPALAPCTAWPRMLPKAFVDEDFEFYGKKLSGGRSCKPRWKRCVAVDRWRPGRGAGPGLRGARIRAGEPRQRALRWSTTIEKAHGGRHLERLPWMGRRPSEAGAARSCTTIANKIGYPDKWRDYVQARHRRAATALGNVARADAFEFHRQLAKIGKPVDRTEWDMTPPTVNAYYDPPDERDRLSRPGILQPPFFDPQADDAAELRRHRRGDRPRDDPRLRRPGPPVRRQGNLRDWWTTNDGKAFKAARRDSWRILQVRHGEGPRTLQGRARQRQADLRRKHRRQRRA